MEKLIKLSQIIVDERFQPRESLIKTAVEEYADLLREGSECPPVVVFETEDENYLLTSGFHRFEAHKINESVEIKASVRSGSELDMLVEAIESNSRHGIKYSNEDKRKCIILLLNNPEAKNWSDNKIGQIWGVSNHLVKKIRLESNIEKPKEIIVTKNSRKYSLNTTAIGKNQNTNTNLNRLLKSQILDLSKTLGVFIQAYKDTAVEIPGSFKEKIQNFINWYSNKMEV